MNKTKPKAAVPALQVFISDKQWPLMELLIVSDDGREYSSVVMYDICASQFESKIKNALQDRLRVAVEAGKGRGKR